MAESTKDETPSEPTNPQDCKAGDRLVKIVDGIEYAFRWCPPGTFLMGSSDMERKDLADPAEKAWAENEVPHQVTLTEGFWMLETPVTFAMWKSVMKKLPRIPILGFGRLFLRIFKHRWDSNPVWRVHWNDCQEFCRNLSSKVGMRISLPTEAQWEYACRAGTTGPYAGSLDEMGWYQSNSGGVVHPAAQKKPNAWGLYDMHGNVWEWCQDWYGSYPLGSVTNPTGPASGSCRALRGGGWDNSAGKCRSAFRFFIPPDICGGDISFRVIASSK